MFITIPGEPVHLWRLHIFQNKLKTPTRLCFTRDFWVYILKKVSQLGSDFTYFSIFIPIWGRWTHFDDIIFFRWVGPTTNPVMLMKPEFLGARSFSPKSCHPFWTSGDIIHIRWTSWGFLEAGPCRTIRWPNLHRFFVFGGWLVVISGFMLQHVAETSWIILHTYIYIYYIYIYFLDRHMFETISQDYDQECVNTVMRRHEAPFHRNKDFSVDAST